ncbi:MAG: hypothetical protein C5B50_20585 [Verrucomicrobia bacterium]|nr:MAG: hypothetical protein C5B50_20585 [Verrucomicrobiota bacterium]
MKITLVSGLASWSLHPRPRRHCEHDRSPGSAGILPARATGSRHAGKMPALPGIRAIGTLIALAGSLTPAFGATHQNRPYGFEFEVPEGWSVRATNVSVAHYSDVFLTVNSRRPDLVIGDWQSGPGAWEFGLRAIYQQLQPGEVNVAFVLLGGPGPLAMGSDTVGNDLVPLLATNAIKASDQQPGLSQSNFGFFKHGMLISIWASLREPIAEGDRRKVMAMLRSFRFLDAPVGCGAWAESLAWEALPETLKPSSLESWEGWPQVCQNGADSGSSYERRGVVVAKTGSVYSVQFTLNSIGAWRYSVSTDGKVQPEQPVIYPVGVPPWQMPTDLPGESKGKPETFWVDPYVQASVGLGKTTLTWYNKDGSIKRQAATQYPSVEGFVHLASLERTIQGLNEDWRINFPSEPAKPWLAGLLRSTRNSRVCIRERHPEQGTIVLDFYVHGKLTETAGPFLQYMANDFELNEDGSAGLFVWKDESKTRPQIVTFDPAGKLRFRVDCGGPVTGLIVAPGGKGALAQPNPGEQNAFLWFTERGKVRSMAINPSAQFLGWIPESRKSLFMTEIGTEDRHFQLIDWDTGKRLWQIPWPSDGQALGYSLGEKVILFAVAQPYPASAQKSSDNANAEKQWVRAFYAISAQDGSIVARWQALFPHRSFYPDRDHFLRLGEKLFYVTVEDFTEIKLADIMAKEHGWE